MATIFPPTFEDVGTPTDLTWTPLAYVDPGNPAQVAIYGSSDASFVSAGAASETFDIEIDGGGIIPVSSVGTETTPADWVLTINTAAGSAVAVVDLLGGIRLEAALSIELSNYNNDAAFAVVGIPELVRNVTDPTTPFPYVDNSTNVFLLSDPFDIDPRATEILIRTIGAGNDPVFDTQIQWTPVWSEGVGGEGEPSLATTPSDLTSSVFSSLFVYPLVDASLDAATSILTLGHVNSADVPRFYVTNRLSQNTFPFGDLKPLPVPPGRRRLRIFVFRNKGVVGVPNLVGARFPPAFAAKVYAAAR